MSQQKKCILHRKIIFLTVIVILVLSLGIRCFQNYQSFRYMMPLEKIVSFDLYKESFVQLAEYLYNRYEIAKDNRDNLICIHFYFYPGENVLGMQYRHSDPDFDYADTESVPYSMCKHYENVSAAFQENSKYGFLSNISVHDNTVAFCRVAYAIVYTRNGFPPDTITSPNSTNNIYSERIGLHWFHSISDFYV